VAYDPAQTEAKDVVRFLIGDTGSTEVFADAEITAAIARNGSNVYLAAAECVRAMATNRARFALAIEVLAGEWKVDERTVAAELRRLEAIFIERADQNATFEIQQPTDEALEDVVEGYTHARLYDDRDEDEDLG